jgi:hypothetical protein
MDKSGPIFVGEPLGETLSALSVSIRGAGGAGAAAKRPKRAQRGGLAKFVDLK